MPVRKRAAITQIAGQHGSTGSLKTSSCNVLLPRFIKLVLAAVEDA